MADPTVILRDTGQRLAARDYLCGVVPSEMPASWPEAALRALCVAAASYAASKGWVVWSDSRDQTYDAAKRTERTDTVVDDMLGIVLWYADQSTLPVAERGKPARAYYSAYCGGKHERKWGAHLTEGHCYCVTDTPEAQRRWYEQHGGGHRQGLCQQGARALAERGYSWQQILAWYYTLGSVLELRKHWGETPPLWPLPACSALYELARDSRRQQEIAIAESKGQCDAVCRRLLDNLQREHALERALRGQYGNKQQ